MSAEDSLAVSMLVILVIAGGTLMTIFYSLLRNAGKEDELEELLKEEPETPNEPESEPAGGEVETAQPWEKDADWWQK